MLFMISWLVFILMMLMSVAFLTLFELHLMGFSQIRVGPDKNSFMGMLQFMFDGLKLLKKEFYLTYYSFKFYYLVLPMMFFFYFFYYWFILMFFNSYNLLGNFLFFMSLIGMSVYFFILLGIFSKSKYSVLGSMRASSQTISFEISWFFFMFMLMFNFQSMNFMFLNNIMFNSFFILFIMLILLELNRTPFDFFESESELVSGYNTEYLGFFFVFLILSEYGMMIFFSILSMFVFFNSFLVIYMTMFFILFLRTIYPRYRYDFMMSWTWLILLPIIMIYFTFWFFLFLVF